MAERHNAALKTLLRKPGWHGVGDGLYFRCEGSDKAYWVYRYTGPDGRRRVISLGPYPEVSLAQARARHAELRARVIADKADPLAEKRAARATVRTTPSFGDIADDHLRAHQPQRKNERHRQQWFVALTTYCAPIRDRPIDTIDTEAVHAVLKPVWTRAPVIASRLRGRIEAVLSAAQALGHIPPDRANPARWRGHLDHLLSRTPKGRHLAAMPYRDVPAFMARLATTRGTTAIALRFAILCAARSDEVFGMTWDEVDLDSRTWTVPAERMKMAVEHVVPLSDAALAILRTQLASVTRRGSQTYVFPGAKPGRPLSKMSLIGLVRGAGVGNYTVHGFRSSFRNFAADSGVAFDVAEACLAHAVGNAVTRAYLQSTMVERRRVVMADWAAFLSGQSADAATVVSFRAATR